MILQPEANILNALDDAACVFEKTPLRSMDYVIIDTCL